ncbi:MAG: 2Fe-2S iron-sulfur cluster binding domain-containing protein, partial [candidate division NC10 bacterium]|nr:2Fe-2S iron-sulfur cluster binding domain-containing protein [candidate division NC10 bacterium]
MTRTRKVRFEPLGITIECEATEPILQYALRQGLRLVDYRCADGECGGCKARIRSGQVHLVEPPTHVLSPSEQAQGHVLLCRTHVQSDLVIELLAGSLLAPPLRPDAARLLGPLVAVADYLSDGLLVLDAQGQLVLCNRAAALLLRLDPAAPSLAAYPELQAVGRTLLTDAPPAPQEVKVYDSRNGRLLTAWGVPLHGHGGAALLLPAQPRLEPPSSRKPKAIVVGAKYTFTDLVGASAAFRNATKIGLIAAGNTLSVLIAG